MNPCLEFGMWGNVGIIKAIRISFIMKKELYQVYSEYWTLDIVLLLRNDCRTSNLLNLISHTVSHETHKYEEEPMLVIYPVVFALPDKHGET